MNPSGYSKKITSFGGMTDGYESESHSASVVETSFLLDSGSTDHLIESPVNMRNITVCTRKVTIVDGKQISATHQGTIAGHCRGTGNEVSWNQFSWCQDCNAHCF
jgi:hypothetical protein